MEKIPRGFAEIPTLLKLSLQRERVEIIMLSLNCVPISTYCKETGETSDAINKRVQRAIWHEGVQVLKVDGVKERWIDLDEVSKWARKNKIKDYRGG